MKAWKSIRTVSDMQYILEVNMTILPKMCFQVLTKVFLEMQNNSHIAIAYQTF